MIASARVAYLAKRGADYGVHTEPVTVDMVKVRERKRNMVTAFRSSDKHRIESTKGVDLLMAEARFTGPKTVEVRLHNGETRQLRANTIFLNVGARPAVPSLSGLEQVSALNSTTIMELATVPEHLLVVGGGYVGLEFGQMFCRFGSQVTIVERSGHLLTSEDDDEVAKILREDGIEVLLQTNPVRVEQPAADTILLTVRGPDGERTLRGSHVLIATGRVPNSDWLNLEAAGVEMDKQNIVVTFTASPEEKALFLEILGSEASLTFLDEIPPAQREQVLEGATILLSWNFPREIGQEDYPYVQQVRLIQLLSAGADHMPFADLPSHMLVASNPGAYAAPMAEHVLAMTLALAKRLLVENQKLRNGEFDQFTPNRLLSGMTAGILGFGGSGEPRLASCGHLV